LHNGESEHSVRAIFIYLILKKKMARVTGLEPATSGVTGRRSNQLSYTRIGARRSEVRYLRSAPGAVKRLWAGNAA
jgi:hypothetical protein